MPLLSFNKAEKMKIYVYEKPSRGFLDASQEFEFMFNPETYSLDFATTFSCKQSLGSPGRPARFVHTPPSKLNVTILIDGTGVLKTGAEQLLSEIFSPVSVHDKVAEFVNLTINPISDTHEPSFLRLVWGKLNFHCRLVSCSVKYTLFDKSGKPLRAEIPCTFISDMDVERMKKKANFLSPDLTHQRTVQAGDDLLIMTHRIYGSPDWYIKVAKVNGLNSFRDIQPGQTLIFPPIKDLDA
jgi:Contractile injection system tube protein